MIRNARRGRIDGRRKRARAPGAFTLVEALALIAIMAVIAGAAAVSLSGASRSVRVEDAAERLVAFDRSARELAKRFGRTPNLRFEIDRGTVARVEDGRDAVPLPLGGDVRVTRVVLRGRALTSGAVSVWFSPRGQTPSYAVLLAGPAGERWVTVAGLTGQAVVLSDERDAHDILWAASNEDDAVDLGGRADAR